MNNGAAAQTGVAEMTKFYEVSINGSVVARFADGDEAQRLAERLAMKQRGVAVYQVEREAI
jgi:hypothetical protein